MLWCSSFEDEDKKIDRYDLLGAVWMYAFSLGIRDWHLTGLNIPNASVWLA
jgi:hypothetical protein